MSICTVQWNWWNTLALRDFEFLYITKKDHETAIFRQWSKQCCAFRIQDPVPFWPRDPGWKKIKTRILDEHPGSYFWELRNNFLGWKYLILCGIRDPESFWPIRDGKIRIRDKHPGSATLDTNDSFFLFAKVLESLAEEVEEVVATWSLFDPGSGMEKFGSGIIIPDPQHWSQTIDLYLSVKVLESLAEEDDEVVATWYLLGWMNFLR